MNVLRLSLLLVAAAAVGFGCQTAPKAGLSQAIADYEAQRFTVAHRGAVEVMRSGSGVERDQAAYVAGLSAYRLGEMEEAELRLLAAANSSDQKTAGSAKAMLGQMRLAQHRPREAAQLLEAAATGLDGEDARQAARYASMAHHMAGDDAAAKRWQAASAGSPGGSTASPSTGTGMFTIQVGAFQERQRAEAAAAGASDLARREGLGEPFITSRTDARGRVLYVVQFGRFVTRTTAEQVHTRLGRKEYIVAPLAR